VTERIRTCLYLLGSDSVNSRPSPPLHFERSLATSAILKIDEKLIELVRKCEELYDMGNKEYSDSVWKEKVWGQIGEELNKSGKLLMLLFQILNLPPFNHYQSSNKINTSLRNHHVLFRKVTEQDGECEHRAF
jgi:hypothetical protein